MIEGFTTLDKLAIILYGLFSFLLGYLFRQGLERDEK